MTSSRESTVAAYAYSLLRIVFGFLFSCHGLSKVAGLFGGMGGTGARAPVLSFLWFSGLLELGGLLVLVGLFTRIISFILSGEMAMAYFVVHFPHGFWPIKNGGERAVIYCFLLLYFSAAGAGSFSLDHAIWGRTRRQALSS